MYFTCQNCWQISSGLSCPELGFQNFGIDPETHHSMWIHKNPWHIHVCCSWNSICLWTPDLWTLHPSYSSKSLHPPSKIFKHGTSSHTAACAAAASFQEKFDPEFLLIAEALLGNLVCWYFTQIRMTQYPGINQWILLETLDSETDMGMDSDVVMGATTNNGYWSLNHPVPATRLDHSPHTKKKSLHGWWSNLTIHRIRILHM